MKRRRAKTLAGFNSELGETPASCIIYHQNHRTSRCCSTNGLARPNNLFCAHSIRFSAAIAIGVYTLMTSGDCSVATMSQPKSANQLAFVCNKQGTSILLATRGVQHLVDVTCESPLSVYWIEVIEQAVDCSLE